MLWPSYRGIGTGVFLSTCAAKAVPRETLSPTPTTPSSQSSPENEWVTATEVSLVFLGFVGDTHSIEEVPRCLWAERWDGWIRF